MKESTSLREKERVYALNLTKSIDPNRGVFSSILLLILTESEKKRPKLIGSVTMNNTIVF